MTQWFGLQEELIGRNILDYIHPDDVKEFAKQFREKPPGRSCSFHALPPMVETGVDDIDGTYQRVTITFCFVHANHVVKIQDTRNFILCRFVYRNISSIELVIIITIFILSTLEVTNDNFHGVHCLELNWKGVFKKSLHRQYWLQKSK